MLAREAVRLGLDRDDAIVRRHLAQKMAFVSDDLAVVGEPAQADLRAYFDAHRQTYTTPDLYALRHVFFNPDRHGMALDKDAQQALQRLARGANPNDIGDPFMLPRELADVSRDDIARDFGSVFADAVTGPRPGPGPARCARRSACISSSWNRIRQAAWRASRTCAIACARRCSRRSSRKRTQRCDETAPAVQDRRRDRQRQAAHEVFCPSC